MQGPLATLKVVEFSGLGPAPLAGQMLADMGADVITIDRVAGAVDPSDVNRRGKRSIVLDLKSGGGQAAALALIGRADIVIEGFRPGVMERLGLGPKDCPEQVIYGRMTGWGQTGPMAQVAGHDITYLATTGVLGMMGPSDAPPAPPMNLVADYGGGTMFLLYGLLAAVIERGVSGKGQVVDAAMIDGVPAMMGLIHGMMAQGDWMPERSANMLDGGAPFYRCYACADGQHVAVGALEPQFYALLLNGLGLKAADLPDQNDRRSWPAMHDRFAQIFAGRSRDEWSAVFAGTDACVAPVLSIEEAAVHPHMADRAVYVAPGGVRQSAPAPRFGRSVPNPPEPPNARGADTDAILAELGIDPTDGGGT